ncbi:MAG TPA: hypothetical protein DEQ30_08480 [Porphyromonadaceae bacterium]|nr:hypothetical protein [Porphyromonadaceae bacterium]
MDKWCGSAWFPVKLNSAYRPKKHDLKKGRTGTGPHTFGPCELSGYAGWGIIRAVISVCHDNVWRKSS